MFAPCKQNKKTLIAVGLPVRLRQHTNKRKKLFRSFSRLTLLFSSLRLPPLSLYLFHPLNLFSPSPLHLFSPFRLPCPCFELRERTGQACRDCFVAHRHRPSKSASASRTLQMTRSKPPNLHPRSPRMPLKSSRMRCSRAALRFAESCAKCPSKISTSNAPTASKSTIPPSSLRSFPPPGFFCYLCCFLH